MHFFQLFLVFMVIFANGNCWRMKRSMDLAASHALIPDERLSKDVVPEQYEISLHPNIEESTFRGSIKIGLSWEVDSNKIFLHAHQTLKIDEKATILHSCNAETDIAFQNVSILRMDRLPRKNVLAIYLREKLKKGLKCELHLNFTGEIWDTVEGLFKGTYVHEATQNKELYLATYMRPNNARRLFPCYDEPEYKVPFIVSIGRSAKLTTLFNTKLKFSEHISSDYIVDHFETTPPMSTFTFGFVTAQLKKLKVEEYQDRNTTITVWTNGYEINEINELYSKLYKIYGYLENYFNLSIPFAKLDVVCMSNLPSVRPFDNWGLLVFKDTDILQSGYYGLTQELLYQWLGAWITPLWWSDALVNKALVSFLAAHVAFEIDNGAEFNGKYPMTILYSLYYEYSKRYPHSKITGMKQETTSYKTELMIRMLNYTLNQDTFRAAIQELVVAKRFSTFYGNDFWNILTTVSIANRKLSNEYSVAEIAESWITKDRLPVVTVTRNYLDRTANIVQEVYLRERPHDVPEQDKMLWWIPFILVQQEDLNFKNFTPLVWLKKTKETKIYGLPDQNNFIIINPEEIAPFPVNYDERNWELLSEFLQREHSRLLIPPYTRAKLLHDAWNLAYAGNLNFASAFNMTLFMRHERDHIVWNPVFTFIDHIGRHIDMFPVHKKFQMYVRVLLTPLYEELQTTTAEDELWKKELRNLSYLFLCRSGYTECIKEAQEEFKKWMNTANPDFENPVQNQYVCPVFKWGTMEEWEFGLQRVNNYPKNRTQSERTYLLKTLAKCPVDKAKIERLLNFSIFDPTSNFTDTDISLIFNMLTGGSTGYTTLFKFLSENWVPLSEKFENKTNLWDNLIGSATGVFKTQEGYELVNQLHKQRLGEFRSAEHIIEKSLRNIKEETKWSNENLPVIENWLNWFLSTYQSKKVVP